MPGDTTSAGRRARRGSSPAGPCGRRGRGCGWRSRAARLRGAHDGDEGLEDMAGGLRVEIAGRLVGEQQRAARSRPRGRWRRAAARRRTVRRADASSRSPRPRKVRSCVARVPRLRLREAADELRHHHVLERRELRQQMVELVDEAELLAADARCARHRPWRRSAAPPTIDLAAVGLLEQARDVQQRRLAGAGRRDQRDDLARPDREIGAAQDLERGSSPCG